MAAKSELRLINFHQETKWRSWKDTPYILRIKAQKVLQAYGNAKPRLIFNDIYGASFITLENESWAVNQACPRKQLTQKNIELENKERYSIDAAPLKLNFQKH